VKQRLAVAVYWLVLITVALALFLGTQPTP